MESIVISIGGSVLLSEDAAFLKQVAKMLTAVSSEYRLYIIVGGGKIACQYIATGRELGFSEEILDEIGIDVTRLNAKLFSGLFANTNDKIPFTTDEASRMNNPLVIMGGTTPGHSTDMVGAELAEKVGARLFVIATNVDGIFDKDPHIHADAKQLQEMTIDTLIQTYGTGWSSAGKNMVVDGPALAIIKRSKLSTHVVNGKRLDQLEKAIRNQPFNGTKILV